MKKRKIKIFLSLFFIFSLCISVFTGGGDVSFSTKTDASTISDLSREQENIQNQLSAIRAEKQQLTARSSDLEGELAWLNSRTEAERQEYEKLVAELEEAYRAVDDAFEEARLAEKSVREKQEEYTERIIKMFENSSRSTLEMLFSAKDLTSFLANAQLISIIAESDRQVIDELNAAMDEAHIRKQAAIDYSDDLKIFVEEKNARINDLRNNISRTQSQISDVRTEISNAERQERELRAQSNRIADEIKRLQSQRNYYGGDMVWPTPGNSRITSPFGSRYLFGYWAMHNGIDIGAPFDSKIVAAADGEVIVRETIPGYDPARGNNYGAGGGGYGNYIIIDHGGGISTVYAHAKLLRVNLGDKVKAGQWIADVGSTGLSTGPHLHFEIRENGNPVNPMQSKYLGVR